MGEVPVTAIYNHPQKFPHISLKLCSAISGKFRAFVWGFPSGGARGVGVWGDTLLRTGLNTLIHSLGGRGIRGTSQTQSQV